MRKKLQAIRDRLRLIWNLPAKHEALCKEAEQLREQIVKLATAQNEIEQSRVQFEKEQIKKALALRGSAHQRLRWLTATDGGRDLEREGKTNG